MKKRRSAYRTQWAAQFAVASELCKRGHQVALTLGNQPMVDLMVVSPGGKPYLIDVKGLYRPNFWAVRQREPKKDLYYVFAFVPDKGANRFFVLTQSQVNKEIVKEMEAARDEGDSQGRKWREGVSLPMRVMAICASA